MDPMLGPANPFLNVWSLTYSDWSFHPIHVDTHARWLACRDLPIFDKQHIVLHSRS